jgi:AcrR family transcriptional regulator
MSKVILNHMTVKTSSKSVGNATSKRAVKPYHHGDLRTSLIAAAREALETIAPEDISFKGLAVHLGVTQPAPYRHFADREALLMAVAIEGFREFCAEIAPRQELSAREDFVWGCDAYMRFARKNRGLYRLMFASRLLKRSDGTELSKVAGESFTILLDRVQRGSGAAGTELNAVWVWSTLHGLAMLDAEDISAGPLSSRLTSKQVIRQMVDLLMYKRKPTA